MKSKVVYFGFMMVLTNSGNLFDLNMLLGIFTLLMHACVRAGEETEHLPEILPLRRAESRSTRTSAPG